MGNPAIANLSRNERRLILAKEARARKTGNWPEWRLHTFPKGSASPDPRGWAFHFEVAYSNDVFSVLRRSLSNGVEHLGVSSLSGIRPTWPEMQRIKDEVAGPDATAVEVYPPQAEIIDQADMFHIWVLPDPLPFSLFDARAA